MSAGFKPVILRLATPSITTRGELSPRVFEPLILIVALSLPGSPDVETATKPGNRPANVFVKLVAGDCSNALPLTVVIDPVTVAFLETPYPTTTTLSKPAINFS